MKLKCCEDGGDPDAGPVIAIAVGVKHPRAAAAAKFCAMKDVEDDARFDGRSPVDIVVVPEDDEARALPGWDSDEDGPFLLLRVTPQRTVRWAAEQVQDFLRYGQVKDGEHASEETD